MCKQKKEVRSQVGKLLDEISLLRAAILELIKLQGRAGSPEK